MTDLVSIDPGVKTLWVAHWTEGKLRSVQALPAQCGYQVADALRQDYPQTLAIEVPQIYQGRVSATDQNDLIDLAIRVGWAEAAGWQSVARYRPREWKGQLPKDICNKRTLLALTQAERDVVRSCGIRPSLQHNIIDAVGIGLKHLGRR